MCVETVRSLFKTSKTKCFGHVEPHVDESASRFIILLKQTFKQKQNSSGFLLHCNELQSVTNLFV